MKIHYKYFIGAVMIISLLLSSCAPQFYSPVRNPTPLFKNKGDIYIDASVKPESNGEITAGYAITNNFAAYAGFLSSSFYTKSPYKSVRGTSTMKMSNIGIGFYKNQINSPRDRLEIFGEYAMGHYNLTERDNNYLGGQKQFFRGNINRISLLINFGSTSLNGKFTQGYSVRLGNLLFSDNTVSHQDYWVHYLRMLNQHEHHIMEHAYFGRFGNGDVKLQYQLALYHAFNTGPNSEFNAGLVLGIVINPNILGKNKKAIPL